MAYALPILATLALWWGSTGAIFYVDNLNPRTYPFTLAGATVLTALALWGASTTSGDTHPGAAYAAISYGLICWGWQIVTFYTGFLTGPNKTRCPPGLDGWRRFIAATGACSHHELSALVGAVLLLAIVQGQVNQLAFWTYVVLWWMHVSAKLNVFFGAPNLGEHMLPERMRYLASYMRKRPMNLFFPFSVTASTALTVWLVERAAYAPTRFEATGATMLATLMALAVAEHWFLVAPLDGNALWAPLAPRDRREGFVAAVSKSRRRPLGAGLELSELASEGPSSRDLDIAATGAAHSLANAEIMLEP